MKSTGLLTIAACAAMAAGCDSSVSGKGRGGGGSLPMQIAVTRQACTPFGNPPRQLQPVSDGLFRATCLGGGGKDLEDWTDAEGTQRQACVYEPAAASADHRLPLVIYLHPSLVGVDLTLAVANIRSQLETADLSDDPQRPGFILMAPYGRVTTRYYPFPDAGGTPGWDNWYRQLQPDVAARTVNGQSYPENVDAATIDHYLQEVLATGKVDEQRIYMMGWSNGSAMGVLYSLNRPMIAAAAVYSAPDPMAAFNDPCPQLPVVGAPKDDTELQLLNPSVPIYHVHNSCDIAGLCPNALRLKDRLSAAGVPVEGRIIEGISKQPVDQCLDVCGTNPNGVFANIAQPSGYLLDLPGYALGTANHLFWPRGWTDEMFGFLREHPRR